MILHEPFFIGSALAPALKVADGTLSLLAVSITDDSRDRAQFELVIPDFTHVDSELRSGCGGFTSPVEAFDAFLDFLYAAAESLDHELFWRGERKGENMDLFPRHVVEWALDNRDDIAAAQMSIHDEHDNLNFDLIEEN